MITPPIKTAITTSSTFVAVKSTKDAPGVPQPYAFWTADYTDFLIATDSTGSDAVTIPCGEMGIILSLDIKPDDDGTLFYCQGTTSTNLILIRGLKR